jgi:hypothetical protein
MTRQMTIRAAMLIGAAAALLACGKQAAVANNSENSAAAEPAANAAANAAAANTAAPAAPPAAGALTADYMVGKWSAIGEDCKATIDFKKDGTVTTPIGHAKWTVTGDKLSINYGDGSEPTASSIKVLDPNRIEITHSSGTKETEKRCS